MTILNYYVREYLCLYREYRKAVNISDIFLLHGKINFIRGELRKDTSLDYQSQRTLYDRFFELSCLTCWKFGERIFQNDF